MTQSRSDSPADSSAGRPDRHVFEREVQRLMDRLYGAALRLTRDPHDAEDIVAEAVGKAWASLDQLQDGRRMEGWLFRTLTNTFVDTWRRRRSRQDLETQLDADGGAVDDGEDFSLYRQLHQPFLLWWSSPEERFINDLLQEDIQAALDALPDAFRTIVVLVELWGYTYEETATLLDIPLGTVRSRLSRGRALLQRGLWEQAREAGLVDGACKPRSGVKGNSP